MVVSAVTPAGAAARSGMKPGEVIVSVDGIATPIVDALATALAQLRPGATVPIVVEHQDGKQTTLHVTLGTYPGR